ncbi:hypothetical protein [Vibrio quintilis]|uniref:Uncharacterized protein n=1 Tax=Vibrio quintilis TaxID=1117707 RepID=A0A1M7YNZ8_9VIBR|nr:hypothetical protein [Vibrio quintilis]SHO54329.1 hypothetical protein VQ7734_00043 [Vibrio quintilis]
MVSDEKYNNFIVVNYWLAGELLKLFISHQRQKFSLVVSRMLAGDVDLSVLLIYTLITKY